jgi:hypothetical protein
MRILRRLVPIALLLALPAAGQERWTPIGPPSPILPIGMVLDPFSSTLYVYEINDDGTSGLWKTTDEGRHWTSINEELSARASSSAARTRDGAGGRSRASAR